MNKKADELASQLKAWDDEIEKLNQKVKKATEEAKKKYREQIVELMIKKQEAKRKG